MCHKLNGRNSLVVCEPSNGSTISIPPSIPALPGAGSGSPPCVLHPKAGSRLQAILEVERFTDDEPEEEWSPVVEISENSKVATETNLGTSHDASSGEDPSTNLTFCLVVSVPSQFPMMM